MKLDRYETIFSDKFEIGEIKDTAYHGTLNPLPKDLFAMITKKQLSYDQKVIFIIQTETL